MQIVVMSDAHGKNEVYSELRNLYPNASAYLCCGDSECDEDLLDGFVSVLGNNDYQQNYPHHLIIDLKEVRIYMQHGDRLPRMGLIDHFTKIAHQENCSLVCFGHTHIFEEVRQEGVVILNPGSIYHNRDGSQSSYALVTIQGQDIHIERKTLEKPKKEKKRWF